ncbi:sugar ABC transporter permease [Clostridium tyrobutyricum]|jgi:sn-glycerol 3-phosphate transport system permease protein|uniref:carbohydrate ABC transporter permease n=1 Tax=Clostridium tyrobutyricum TaxID=1519 RepID=UPI0002F4FAB1|nr:sugar ABC transporter permease [Clostridium tyrobutyricum]MBR9647491.1 sugar ABC transporter permease [Clostridium tyrobutyricum]MBV4448925.1 sugar ABC transporter permease [Clostridium tyrobutyricum]QCH28215.1 sn-glycerol-3-phosphate transport system permease protein UgpA [Clostridium tyrobutyricum]
MEKTAEQVGLIQKTVDKKKVIKTLEPYFYIVPCMIIFVGFTYFPFLKTIYLSLFNTNASGEISSFAGMSNYINLFKSPSFINSIVVTLKYVIVTTIPSILIGLILSLVCNNKLKFKGLFGTMYAIPMAVSSASASVIWVLLFNPSIGLINFILKKNIGWLTSPYWAFIAVSIVSIWLKSCMNFIFIISALKNIPEELVESASIDGANYLQRLKNVILPCISPTLFFVIVIDIIQAFQTFAEISIMTTGGPGEATNVLVYSIYKDAFYNNRFGVASAESIILFLIMLVITLFQFRYEKKKVFYK